MWTSLSHFPDRIRWLTGIIHQTSCKRDAPSAENRERTPWGTHQAWPMMRHLLIFRQIDSQEEPILSGFA